MSTTLESSVSNNNFSVIKNIIIMKMDTCNTFSPRGSVN